MTELHTVTLTANELGDVIAALDARIVFLMRYRDSVCLNPAQTAREIDAARALYDRLQLSEPVSGGLSIELETGNAAFDGERAAGEVSRILCGLAGVIERKGLHYLTPPAIPLKDINGNRVGFALYRAAE